MNLTTSTLSFTVLQFLNCMYCTFKVIHKVVFFVLLLLLWLHLMLISPTNRKEKEHFASRQAYFFCNNIFHASKCSLKITNSTRAWSLQPRLPAILTSVMRSSALASTRSSKSSPRVGPYNNWTRNLHHPASLFPATAQFVTITIPNREEIAQQLQEQWEGFETHLLHCSQAHLLHTGYGWTKSPPLVPL